MKKDPFYQEINHRTKNHLTALDAFIALEQWNHPDESVEAFSRRVRQKIQLFIQLYEILCSIPHGKTIRLDLYLQNIFDTLMKAFSELQNRVTTRFTSSEVSINPEKAVYWGCILNEIVMNSIKHAFPGKSCGSIHVSLTDTPEEIILNIADSGTPKAPGAEPGSGLGKDIIQALIAHLNGKTIVSQESGTAYEIRAPKN